MVKRKSTKEQTTIYKAYIYKTKDRVTRTPLKTGVNSGAPEREAVPAPLVALVIYDFCGTLNLVI